jgi:hypothetical protein
MQASKYSEFYSSAVRLAASAFIQDPLTLDLVINAPALTHQGIVIARDRLRHISRRHMRGSQTPKVPADAAQSG